MPLFAAIYWAPDIAQKKGCTPFAAAMALLVGSILRGILEFTLPIDGLLLVGGVQSFAKGFGPAYFENFIPDLRGFAWADDWGAVYEEQCVCIKDMHPNFAGDCDSSCADVTLGLSTSADACIAAGDCMYLNKPDAYKGGVYAGPASGLVGPNSGGVGAYAAADAPAEELPMAAVDDDEMCPMIVRLRNF